MEKRNHDIRAILFDLGEVIIKLDFSKLLEQFPIGVKGTLYESLESLDRWETYDQFERGKIGEKAFIEKLSSTLGRPIPYQEFVSTWNTVLRDPVPGIEDLLEKLKPKFPLYALTNSTETHIRHVMKDYPVMKHFRMVFTSFDLGHRKPELEAFKLAAERMGLVPKQILFVDDRHENVEGARRAGFHAEWIRHSPDDIKSVLKTYGIA